MALFFLILFSFTASATEFCFESLWKASKVGRLWEHQGKQLTWKLQRAGQKVETVKVTFSISSCRPCFTMEGDSYITGIFEEKYAEIKKDIPVPGAPLEGVPLDVSLGTNVPWADRAHEVRTMGYLPFLSFPQKKSNVLYDVDKSPIEISAEVVHPELIEYTARYKGKENKVIYRMNEPVICLFPEETEEFFKQGIFIKEDDKFLEVRPYKLEGFIRDYPQVPL